MIAIEADGVNEKTLGWYQSLLNKWTEYLETDPELETITTTEIRKYILWLTRRYSPSTVHAHKRVQHKFWRWCVDEYDIENPMRNIRYPQQPKKKRPDRAASVDDISLLFEAIDTETIQGKRDKALFAFLIDTGCRRAGVCNLRLRDLNMQERQALVTEKGGSSRLVYFSEFTADILKSWLEFRQSHGSEFVFVNLRTWEGLTPDGVYQLSARYKKKLGIKGRVNPHSFRHAFAREYLKSGGDLKTLSQILGHASIEVTADVYSIFLPEELGEKHDKHSLINKLLDNDNRE